MNNNKIAFIYCVNDHIQFEKSVFSIQKLVVPSGLSVEIIAVEGASSITKGYNIAMKRTDAKYKFFLHQDVFIVNYNIIRDIMGLFRKYPNLGIIGAIGARTVPDNGIWSLSNNRYGKVYESSPGYMRLLSNREVLHDYQSVQAVDGLVMITQYDIPWRDDIFKGWHFYDTSQCFEFLKAGYEVGVPRQEEPWFIHDCGIVNVNGYESDRQVFMEHYKDTMRLT